MTSSKVTYLYDLMDAADDAKRIEQTSRELGHVPITDRNGRGREVIPMAPHEAERYKIRSGAERANSRLKEDWGQQRYGQGTQQGHSAPDVWCHRAVCGSTSALARLIVRDQKMALPLEKCAHNGGIIIIKTDQNKT